MLKGLRRNAMSFLGIILAVVGLATAFAVYLVTDNRSMYRNLVISEVMTSNGSTASDEDGDFRDWIELQNRGQSGISLEGLLLQKGGDDPWQLPTLDLPPSESLLVWASSKDRAESGSELHTDFRLSRDGVQVLLLSSESDVIDSLTVPALARDTSFGRHPSFADVLCFFPNPTPAEPNSGMCIEELLTQSQ